jgi:putative transposase
VFQVSRSGYYKWLNRPMSEKEKRRKKLTARIRQLFLDSRRLYGSPKITKLLQREGIQVSEKTVARLMRAHDLWSRTIKKYKATTNSRHSLPAHENTLNQQFTAKRPNQVWVVDITYIPTREGWLYLASVMDLYSRKIVGWHADSHMTKQLVIQALRQAYIRQQPKESVLHHSDRGSQYASKEYQSHLAQYGMRCSMSRKGNCYNNACIESFYGVLKRELIYQHQYKTREEAKKSLLEYIEIFYNNKRIHSATEYFSLSEYERMYFKNAA